VNPIAIGVPLALLGAILLFARTAEAPGKEPHRNNLLKMPGARWHIKPAVATTRAKGAEPELVAALSKKWSPIFDVPVSWLRSQAYVESKNVLDVVNPITGAAGVLQVLPDTALWLVKSLKKSSYGKLPDVVSTLKKWRGRPGDLLDAELNVMLAAYYMLVLKRKFGEDHDLVAAAYNIGPSKISYYIRTRRPFPMASRIYLAMVKDAKLRGFT